MHRLHVPTLLAGATGLLEEDLKISLCDQRNSQLLSRLDAIACLNCLPPVGSIS